MDFKQILHKLDLVDKEADVYLALISTPGVQPASIIAKKSGLNRTTTYKILMKLTDRGLATKTMRHGILCFYGEDPEKRLEDLVLGRQKSLETLHKTLITLLPAVIGEKKQEMVTPKMRIYEGVEGVKRVYENTLVEGKPIYAFEDVGFMAPSIKDWILKDYVPRRTAEKIFAHVITPNNPHNKNFRKDDKAFCRETRFLASIPVEVEINIYGKKTAFFSYKADEMFGVILESPAITNSMKALFDFCWKQAK